MILLPRSEERDPRWWVTIGLDFTREIRLAWYRSGRERKREREKSLPGEEWRKLVKWSEEEEALVKVVLVSHSPRPANYCRGSSASTKCTPPSLCPWFSSFRTSHGTRKVSDPFFYQSISTTKSFHCFQRFYLEGFYSFEPVIVRSNLSDFNWP